MNQRLLARPSCSFSGVLAVVVSFAVLTACSTDPDTAKQKYFARAEQYLLEKKYDEAIVEYRSALQQDPSFAEARFKLAETYVAKNDYRSAYPEYIRAADLKPDDLNIQARAGNMLLLGRRFEADPRMFSSDRFHPSAEGYARAAAVIMPTLMAALGEDDRTPATGTEGVRTLPQAAQEAVRAAGTEVSPARVGGRERGPAGRWAQLRRHPWFGEQRFRFGHRPAATVNAPVPSSRSAQTPVGWSPEGGGS